MKKLQNWVAYVANLFLVFVWVSALLVGEWDWGFFCISLLGVATCIENIGFRIKQEKDERR